MAKLDPNTQLQFLKGVGPVRAKALESLGLCTVADLLSHYPFRYEIEEGQREIADLEPELTITVRGEVRRVRGRWPAFSAEIDDGSGRCWLRWFNQKHRARGLYVGAQVIATGKVEFHNDRAELIHPRVEVFAPHDKLPDRNAQRKLLGVYPASEAINSNQIRALINNALAGLEPEPPDWLPAALRVARNLMTHHAALQAIHRPAGEAAAQAARRRLAYDELLEWQLIALGRRRLAQSRGQARAIQMTAELDRRIRARLPFTLTAGQDAVVAELTADLCQTNPMARLLQGDVGSGKTAVAVYAALALVAHAGQVAFLAPTEVLARQHAAVLERYLADSKVRLATLVGGLSAGQRTEIRQKLAAGEIDIVVGTHALLEADVSFASLALVIIDEQHKFGVAQRAALPRKGLAPHVLSMSATPIPRTLTLTLFADLEVSIIPDRPPGRGEITTQIIPRQQAGKLYADLAPRLAAGEQAFVVCPAIRENESTESAPLVNVETLFAELGQGQWNSLRLGMLHGSLSDEDKLATIADFAQQRLDALIATTVIEVGVDIPQATIMVIEEAQRFGLAQLHQLRGRVGRGSRDGDVYLISGDTTPIGAQRLSVLTQTHDGFAIAEADLRLRGPGDMIGTRQSGVPALRIANLVEDAELLDQARADAIKILQDDPQLNKPEHHRLRDRLRSRRTI
jgi:ATP-dependent DNA helicase RecG